MIPFPKSSQLPGFIRGMTITDHQKAAFETQLEQWFSSETSDNGECDQAKQRLAKPDRMEKNLQDIFLEEQISRAPLEKPGRKNQS